MASLTVLSAVQTWMATNWTATPVFYENQVGVPPSALTPWLYVEIVGHDYVPDSIGAGTPSAHRWVETGTLVVSVFVRAGSGSTVARQYAEQLANALRGLELPPSIRFRDMAIGASGGSEDGNWWGMDVRADFIRN